MATANKRGKNARKVGSKKTAAKKAAKAPAKKAALKTATPKKAAAKKAVSKKSAPKKSVPKKAAVKKAIPEKKVQSKTTKQSAAKSNASRPGVGDTANKHNASPAAQKKLASRHIWELVEAKKRNAAKTPSWQTIAHHDHPAPRGGQEQSDQSAAASAPIEMPGHRNRGTG